MIYFLDEPAAAPSSVDCGVAPPEPGPPRPANSPDRIFDLEAGVNRGSETVRQVSDCQFFSGLGTGRNAERYGFGDMIELLPGAQASLGMQSLAVGGPLRIAGGAWLASGRKTRRVLALLVGYLVLVSLFGNLPGLIHPDPSGKALAGMITNMAVIGGLLHWMQSEGDHARSGDA